MIMLTILKFDFKANWILDEYSAQYLIPCKMEHEII